MRIESCVFNMDTACIDVVYVDSRALSLYIPAIEESLRTTIYSRSKLDLLLDSDPLAYAVMWIDGALQEYVDQIDGTAEEQKKHYVERLSKQYPPNIAEDITRELLMYE